MLSSMDKVSAVSYLSSSCFRISKCVSLNYGLGMFQTFAFVLNPRVDGSVHDSRNTFSILYRSVGPLDLMPVDF